MTAVSGSVAGDVLPCYVTVTFDKQSNGRRIEVESKSHQRQIINHRITTTASSTCAAVDVKALDVERVL